MIATEAQLKFWKPLSGSFMTTDPHRRLFWSVKKCPAPRFWPTRCPYVRAARFPALPATRQQAGACGYGRQNAREALARHVAESDNQRRLLEDVAETFDLEAPPQRIEVFDNSHLQGTNQIGGMIVAGSEGFVKNQYRKFNIKNDDTVPGDDYAMMREVFTRRYERLAREHKPGSDAWPDLILVDGGRGQLNVAHDVLEELGLADIALVGVAKGPDRDAGRERFFRHGADDFMLPTNSPVLYYLQRLRDEAHRFAIGGHRAKRQKDLRRNALDQNFRHWCQPQARTFAPFRLSARCRTRGIGRSRKVDGISAKMAKIIYDHFHGEGQ